ncbi:MAG: hypothetical protein INR73_22875 [Williamsia sp.]|nr:hypothetical protein [Williamsia sp.]
MLCACQKELHSDTGTQEGNFRLNIRFDPVVDGRPLAFDATNTNFSGEPYTVKTFKFYISQIDLSATDGSVYRVNRNNYYLINEADLSSTTISLTPPTRSYSQLSFAIGVDSARNVSGAQTGALDPANGMFWTWNSGYIMAKLEGSSPLSGAPDNRIEYHIGGFKEPYNVLRRVVLPLSSTGAVSFQSGSTNTLAVSANVNAWFHEPYELRIAKTPVWMTPGDTALRIAQNYSRMFTATTLTRNP